VAAERGAVPLAKLAELDSAAHHLREQADRDRRAQAERNLTFEGRIQRIDEATQANEVAVAGIASSIHTIKWLVGLAIAIGPTAVGAAWALARLIH
jgi:hypothetical protein